jgi:hypothetical protein
MRIQPPCIITPRLLAGIKIGNAIISIDYADREGDENRVRYQWHIDLDGAEYSGDDLQSGNPIHGVDNGLQRGLASLLGYLGACGESYAYDIRNGGNGMGGENSELFPPAVAEWAYVHSDEISMAECELDIDGCDIIEE